MCSGCRAIRHACRGRTPARRGSRSGLPGSTAADRPLAARRPLPAGRTWSIIGTWRISPCALLGPRGARRALTPACLGPLAGPRAIGAWAGLRSCSACRPLSRAFLGTGNRTRSITGSLSSTRLGPGGVVRTRAACAWSWGVRRAWRIGRSWPGLVCRPGAFRSDGAVISLRLPSVSRIQILFGHSFLSSRADGNKNRYCARCAYPICSQRSIHACQITPQPRAANSKISLK